ncbi:caspase family protein [Sandarakinorhabdus limnophila]|uniref:caspase family protein n=1 Tax=Sandarakinorhabdus limnophila TaxID=210512 RepID=UPI0026ED09C1|nr:caspase family protein [Sandarakinorhabdus limnophila]MCM0032102.1 caspase family protein [Sandarakinorhabdus limnophila]
MRLRHLLGLAALIFGLATSGQAQTPRPAAHMTPRVIVQAVRGGIETAAWSADGRTIFTAMGISRELLVWDVATGHIIDRVMLPLQVRNEADVMKMRAMTLLPNGRTLRLDAEILDSAAPNMQGGRTYFVDVVMRRATVAPTPPRLPPLPADTDFGTWTQRWMGALEAIYEGGTDMSEAEANSLLPRLPASPDGALQIVRAGSGIGVRGRDGKTRELETSDDFQNLDHAALSPDGQTVALLHPDEDDKGKPIINIDLLDLADGGLGDQITLSGSYDRLHWLNLRELLALPFDDSDDPLDDAAAGVPSDVLRVDVASGETRGRYPARCFVTSLADGTLIGAGLANCRSGVPDDRALQRLEGGRWVKLTGHEMPKGAHIRLIAASRRGGQLAVVTRLADGTHEIVVVDPATGAPQHAITYDDKDAVFMTAEFSNDGKILWLAGGGAVIEWTPAAPDKPDGSPATRVFEVGVTAPTSLVERRGELMVMGPLDDRIFSIDLASGTARPLAEFMGALAGGTLGNRPIRWAVSIGGDMTLWQAQTGQTLLTTSLLPEGDYVTSTPEGRYDTNMDADDASFRWFVPDEPYQSLSPQTFMRDYFTPRLHRKLVDCATANNCAEVLKPLPSIAGLNRLQPVVTITGVEMDPKDAGDAWVNLEIDEAVNPKTRRRSGLYGLKLLMNGREVARDPDDPDAPMPRTLAEWRKVNRTETDNGHYNYQLRVTIPSDGKLLEFSAYAFNEDRVKSESAFFSWKPPRQKPRQRRAFVLTIGVDAYAEKRLDLNFAVADARLIGERLTAIPGYEMRRASLTTSATRAVTSEHIQNALSLLGGLQVEAAREMLTAAGHDVAQLDEASPDDVVIISFSGHGFADKSGNFALLPSDARWPMAAAGPALDTTVTADDLTLWLRYINAGDIAFIIDACHSGAAVDTPDFKPGPMGDPGLGQLAFDKLIRILAATQADDVALESANLRQGLLTASLSEGLEPGTGNLRADENEDGAVGLDEWLRYAVDRLPSLSEEARRGGTAMAARGVRLVMRTPAAPPRVQEPSLFDFSTEDSPVIVRRR